VISQKMVFTFA